MKIAQQKTLELLDYKIGVYESKVLGLERELAPLGFQGAG